MNEAEAAPGVESDWTYGGRPARWDEERHQWWIGGWRHFGRWVPITDSLMLDAAFENSGKVHPAHGAEPFEGPC